MNNFSTLFAVLMLAAPCRAQFGNIGSALSSAAESMKNSVVSASIANFTQQTQKFLAQMNGAGMNPALAAAFRASAESLAKNAGCAKLPAAAADCAKADPAKLDQASKSLTTLSATVSASHFGAQLPADYYKSQLAAQAPAIAKLGASASSLEPGLGDFKKALAAPLDVWALPTLAANWTKLSAAIAKAQPAPPSNVHDQAFFQRQLDSIAAKLAALGDSSFMIDETLGRMKQVIAAKAPVPTADTLEFSWGKLSQAIQSAQNHVSFVAGKKKDFSDKASAVLAALAAAPGLPASVRADFKAREAALAAKLDCHGRCDDAWGKALYDAGPALDALQPEISDASAGYAYIRSKADQYKFRNAGLSDAKKAKVAPALKAMYDALDSGPLDKARAALEALTAAFATL